MTAPSLAVRPRPRSRLLLAGIGLTMALGVAGPLAPAVVLHGWLIAFASVGGLALGSAAWLAIHALTGGHWGESARPVLLRTSLTLPIVLALALPLVLADRWLYRWAADPASAGAGVPELYLNGVFVAVRSLVLIGGLSLIVWRSRVRLLGRPAAAVALVLYGGLMNLAAFDWLLSLDPRYTSSAFGMQVIVGQLLSALCLVTLALDARDDDPVWADYGALLLASLLGEIYLVLMTFVVHWYGNLPDQAAWYLARSRGPWRWFEGTGVALGAVLPALALLFGRIRRSRASLRVAALAILAGLVAQNIWLVAPDLGPAAGWGILAGLAALAASGSLIWGVADRLRIDPGGKTVDLRR